MKSGEAFFDLTVTVLHELAYSGPLANTTTTTNAASAIGFKSVDEALPDHRVLVYARDIRADFKTLTHKSLFPERIGPDPRTRLWHD